MIKSIRFPPNIVANSGLQGSKDVLRDLGKIVVLAGPNGAGKSRYLRAMRSLSRAASPAEIDNHYEAIAALNNSEAVLRMAGNKDIGRYSKQIPSHEQAIENAKQIEFLYSGSGSHEYVELTYNGERSAIQLTGKMPPDHAVALAHATSTPGYTNAFSGMHAYFTDVATALFEREHPKHSENPALIRAAERAEQFNVLLNKLVRGQVSLDSSGGMKKVTTFRGRPFNPAELSEGEAILATWAIILHQQGGELSNAIIIIDEPENHLHPDAAVRALDALQNIVGEDGQIWVATHAIQIMAYAGLESILFVDDGRISYGGSAVTEIVERLLGGPEGRENFRGFLDDADRIAFCKFAAECLTKPSVAPHKEKDKQESQFVKLVELRQSEDKPLRILDFGAGRGRLGTALQQAREASDTVEKLPPIEYFAYNHSADIDEVRDCRNHMTALATAPGVRRAELVNDLRRFYTDETTKMDVIVLCNVLHEIRVKEWATTFKQMSQILQRDGVVIIMEDQRMRIGELPNEEGFLVLDEIEVAALFGVGPGTKVRAISYEQEGRLSAIEIQAELIPSISKTNIEKALRMVTERAENKVRDLRTRSNKKFQSGREHAYYSMLFMNAKLALSE